MIVKKLIRQMVEEQLTEEARKDRFILENDLLSKEEKEMLIEIFAEHPNLENKIDWNKSKTLTFDDFAVKIKSVMSPGLKDIPKNEFITMKGVECEDELFIGAYIPLSWKAAHILREKEVGGSRAVWCIGYEGDDSYWYRYSYGTGEASYYAEEPSSFIILVFLYEKFAVQYREESDEWIVWDEADDDDHNPREVRTIEIGKLISNNKKLFNDVRKHLDEDPKKPQRLSVGDSVYFDSDTFGDQIQGVIEDIDRDRNECDILATVSQGSPEDSIMYLNGDRYISKEDREEYPEVEIGQIITSTSHGETDYFRVDEIEYEDDSGNNEYQASFSVTNALTGEKSVISEEDVEEIYKDVSYQHIGEAETNKPSERFKFVSDFTPYDERETYEEIGSGDTVSDSEYEGTVTDYDDEYIWFEFEEMFRGIDISDVTLIS